jgi:UDP-glucose 4-epimerase
MKKSKKSSPTVKILEELWYERVQPLLREHLYDVRVFSFPGVKLLLFPFEQVFKLSRVPFIQDRFPWVDPQKSTISWLPINRDIQGAGSIALPEEVLGRLIDKTSHRVIMDVCGCRLVNHCRSYPKETACLMMGESALKITRKVCREVSAEEAKAHVRKAVSHGLVPIAGKARIDNDLFMIRDEGKLLTVCFCCECCCITKYFRQVPQDKLDGIQPPVEGLSIEVTDECIGCGECVGKCYIGAMELEDGRAFITGHCRVCGRCALDCPQDAIKMKLDNSQAVDDVVRRIEAMVEL